jgi:hypothetical protein
MNRRNLIGQRFNRLLVIADAGPATLSTGRSVSTCLVRCDCGEERIVWRSLLVNGNTKSCGCLKTERLKARRGSKAISGSRTVAVS